MDAEFFLGVYWYDRRETADECVDRLLEFFNRLLPCDESVSRWFNRGRSRQDALNRPVDVDSREYLLKLLTRGRYREEELGFQLGFWNGADDTQAISLSIACGGYAQCAPNVVVMTFSRGLGNLSDCERMCCALSATVHAWEPAWGGVQSHEATEARPFEAATPFVDWMVYLNQETLPNDLVVRPPAEVHQLHGGLGAIVVTQPAPPDPKRPDHQQNIERVRLALHL